MTETFEAALRERLTKLDIDLPHELWTFIAWLEERGHRFDSPAGLPFLSVAPSANRDAMWSHVYFVLPPDLVRFWFGKDGLEKWVIPFIHCGGDGSYIALWRNPGDPDRFVFLGSEGEAFTVAERAEDLIAILTMGYPWIEGRDDLAASPEQLWEDMSDAEWPDLVDEKAWVTAHMGIRHPATGSSLLPRQPGDDPFTTFAEHHAA